MVNEHDISLEMANFTLRMVGDRLRNFGPRLCELARAADRSLWRTHSHLARAADARAPAADIVASSATDRCSSRAAAYDHCSSAAADDRAAAG